MNKFLWSTASAMLDRFEGMPTLSGQEAERLVQSLLRACGHEVTESGFIENDEAGVDCYFTTPIDGRLQRIGVEVKYLAKPVSAQVVERALHISESGRFDRAWVIARSGFSRSALRLAETYGPGVIDLLGPPELRSWVTNSIAGGTGQSRSAAIIRRAMQALAQRIANYPAELRDIEWRDLERVLREVFEGIGFETKLTRPGKDGGFDLELSTSTAEGPKTYIVEVKHWADQKPGASHLTKLIKISIEREVDSAILLSTSGFTRTIHAGLLEVGPPVHLGDSNKVISLCKTYYRLSTGFWLQESLPTALFADTSLVTAPLVVDHSRMKTPT